MCRLQTIEVKDVQRKLAFDNDGLIVRLTLLNAFPLEALGRVFCCRPSPRSVRRLSGSLKQTCPCQRLYLSVYDVHTNPQKGLCQVGVSAEIGEKVKRLLITENFHFEGLFIDLLNRQ